MVNNCKTLSFFYFLVHITAMIYLNELWALLLWLIKFGLQICDLSSVSDIKSFASRFSSKDLPIHVLVKLPFSSYYKQNIILIKVDNFQN
jgi:hypothetical protein